VSTEALDVVTILKCFEELEEEFLGPNRQWDGLNLDQKTIFEWYEKYKPLLKKITSLKAKGSKDWQELNEFLVENKFQPKFKPFDGIGVVSILDKMVKWLNGAAEIITINAWNGKTYPGFEIPPSGVEIYKMSGGILAELKTKSEDTPWLFLPDKGQEKLQSLDLIQLSLDVMLQAKKHDQDYAGAKIPMLDFDVEPDISFLLGAYTQDTKGTYWYISQAFQQFKMRMDETGARVKVATGMAMTKGISFGPTKLIFDRPFYGWWTQKGLEKLPMAVFRAEEDSWRKPEGSLEDM
jgi:hypothetical protein